MEFYEYQENFDMNWLSPAHNYVLDDATCVIENNAPQEAVWNPLEFQTEFDFGNVVDEAEVCDIITEAFLMLDKFEISRELCRDNQPVIGDEAGDDRVDFSKDPLVLSLMLVIQERVLHMSTSVYDTFISKRFYNFCEVTSTIPSAKQQSLEYAKKSGFRSIGFVDSPPMRLIMDVRKGSNDHSSTEVGKVTMLGLRLRDTRPDLRMMMDLSFLIQSACLATWRMEEPALIPVEMGGCGAPPPWGDYRNVFLYVRTYKQGTYSRVYGTATNEAYMVVRDNDYGKPSVPILANRLRQRQEYLHGTYAMHVLVPEPQRVPEMPPPLYKALGTTSLVSGVEKRLVRAKLLLGERDARTEWDREVRIGSVITGMYHVNTVVRDQELSLYRRRQEYGGALRANSAFQNLLNRQANGSEVIDLVKQGFQLVSTGALAFTIENAKWIAGGAKGEIFSLADLPSSEDMYLRSEVSSEKTMKIPGLSLTPLWKQGNKSVRTVARLGLWQISATMEDWCTKKVDKILQRREMYPNGIPGADLRDILREDPEWVSDDTLIIGRVIEDLAEDKDVSTATIAVITKDKRLCRQLAQTANCIVLGVHPLAVAHALGRESYDATLEVSPRIIRGMFEQNFFTARNIREPSRCYTDSGSTRAVLQQVAYDAEIKEYYLEKLVATSNDDHRACSISRTKLGFEAIRASHIIAWPNTVTYTKVALTSGRMPKTKRDEPPGRSQKSKMSKFSH